MSRGGERYSLLVTAIVLVATIAAYFPTWSALVERWYVDWGTYSHGFLVAIACLAMIFSTAREKVPFAEKSCRYPVAVVIVLASVAWLLTHYSNILILQAVLMPVILFAALALLFGIRASTDFIFPVAFFYFAIPVWSLFTGILQSVTIAVVSAFLSAVGLTVIVDGQLVSTPTGTFNITTGCAGLHFFIVAFALGSYFSYQTFKTQAKRVAFTLFVVMFAVLVNWVRVATIIVAGYVTDMQHYLVAVDHYRFGWILFVVAMLPVYLMGRWLKQYGNDTASVDTRNSRINRTSEFRISPVFSIIVLLATVPVVGAIFDQINVRKSGNDLILPREIGRWSRSEELSWAWTPNFAGAATELTKSYVGGELTFTVYVNQYELQSQGHELINDNNFLMDKANIRVFGETMTRIQTEKGGSFSGQLLETQQHSGEKKLTLFWYEVGSERLLSKSAVKLQELKSRLIGQLGSGIVAIQVRCRFDCRAEAAALSEFASEFASEMDRQKLRKMASGN